MTMTKEEIIQQTADQVRQKFEGEGTGHDWWHIYRVWQNAKHIGEKEGGDIFVIELGALLHDIADWKFHGGNEEAGPAATKELLEKLEVAPTVVEAVCHIVANVSYKGAGVKNKIETLEGFVVQDADRLDALGAIGIARTFAYGGSRNREMYNPEIPAVIHQTANAYMKNESPTINHFYEKLLLLKDLMNTNTGKILAEGRHAYMEKYLVQFLAEWEGKE
jgi:uncharacterized protein